MIKSILKSLLITLVLWGAFACEEEEVSGEEGFESYRYELWKNLIDDGWQFDFIGTQVDEGNYPAYAAMNFDIDHEGIGGIETDGVLTNLNEVLNNAGSPDVVLLGIGGNDLLANDVPDDVINNINQIIDVLQTDNPNVTIFLEMIAPARSDAMSTEFTNGLTEFNSQITTVVSNQSNENSKVIAVDMNSNWMDEYMADDVHYNEAGAKVVADRYFAAINAELSSSNQYKILPLGDSRVQGARF